MSDCLKAVEKVVARVGDLPAMPEVVVEILGMTESAKTDMADLSEVIERDPGLTAKILRVSNSPYYGMRQYVGTVKLALVILGVREVRNIVLGVSVFEALRNDRTTELLARNFLQHSVTVASLAKRLGSVLEMGFLGEDFVAGLLHDIGKMVLWRQLGREYVKVFKESGGMSERLCALEEARFSFNHADAAAALAMRWNLPRTLTDAIWFHHAKEDRPLEQAKDPQLAALVRVANLAARDTFGQEGGVKPRACEDKEAWWYLSSAAAPIPEDQRAQVLADFVAEVIASPAPVL